MVFDKECRMALEPMQGNWASSQVNFVYTVLFCVAAVTSGSLLTCESVLGTLRCTMKEVKSPFLFDGECRIALHVMQGNWASSHCEGEVSMFFSN